MANTSSNRVPILAKNGSLSKGVPKSDDSWHSFTQVNNYVNSLYLRFEVKDKPGVLSTITNRLAKYKISVKRLIQTPDKKNNKATIVIITHKTNELNSKNCLSVFNKDKNILRYPTLIRIYN